MRGHADPMTLGRFDVCHGDADGLCALRQWRLSHPAMTTLVTGAKRDIELLRKVPVRGTREVVVMDLSLARNRDALLVLLQAGVHVRWFDHHAGEGLPAHALLDSVIDTSAQTCTSLLVDAVLQGRHRLWALVGAYGDNLIEQADALAAAATLSDEASGDLRRLGEAITYNACSGQVQDGCVDPHDLYRRMVQWEDPLSLLRRDPMVQRLIRLRRDDLARADGWPVAKLSERARLVVLPDQAWSRRVASTLADALLRSEPDMAHAVLLQRADGGWRISVRRAFNEDRRQGAASADALCRTFGGAGRLRAAGIDRLDPKQRQPFEDAFTHWAGHA